MATRYLALSLSTFTKQSINTTSSPSSLSRFRPLAAAAATFHSPLFATRSFCTGPADNRPSDPNPKGSASPPTDTIKLAGCDFEHWLVVMDKPEGDPTRDEIIDGYIKTLATVLGSEEEARRKIYSVSTRHYFAFGALVPEELSHKLKELPKVQWVLADSYMDVKNKDYGGEPFINGEAVPYDPKYHEEWVRNNTCANERNKRNGKPRNSDRSRNFDARREGLPGNWNQNPRGNYGGPSGVMQSNNYQQQQPNRGGVTPPANNQ